jgi:hypothetical protein
LGASSGNKGSIIAHSLSGSSGLAIRSSSMKNPKLLATQATIQ